MADQRSPLGERNTWEWSHVRLWAGRVFLWTLHMHARCVAPQVRFLHPFVEFSSLALNPGNACIPRVVALPGRFGLRFPPPYGRLGRGSPNRPGADRSLICALA